MKQNKIIILGIDALEYDLVEEWDLKNLKQEEYGKTILPIKRENGYFLFRTVNTHYVAQLYNWFTPKKTQC